MKTSFLKLLASIALIATLTACTTTQKKPNTTNQIGVDLEALAQELQTVRKAATRQAEAAKRIETTATEILSTIGTETTKTTKK